MRRLLKVFPKQKEGRWGQKYYCDPQAMIYKECLKCCAPCISVMERQFKLPAWNGQNVLLSIIRAVSNFSPLEKCTHHPVPFVFLLLQWKEKAPGLKRQNKKSQMSRDFGANRTLLLDPAEVVNSIIYSYRRSFLRHFFFFPLLRDCFVFNFTTGGQRTSDENKRCFANLHHHPSRDLTIVTKRSKVVIK